MQDAQKITVTVEVTEGIDPAAVVAAINRYTGADRDGDGAMFLTSTEGTPAVMIPGEPFVPGTAGTPIYLGLVTLVA